MKVLSYIQTRQEQDDWLDALSREQVMFRILDAWRWAQLRKKIRRYPTTDDMLEIAKQIEPDHNNGYRTMNVRMATANGEPKIVPRPQDIPQQIELLWACIPGIAPKDFYNTFQDIRPFYDGNHRIGAILAHWIGDTLNNPQNDTF